MFRHASMKIISLVCRNLYHSQIHLNIFILTFGLVPCHYLQEPCLETSDAQAFSHYYTKLSNFHHLVALQLLIL